MADLQETVDQYCRSLYNLHFVSSARVTDPAANVNSDNVDLIHAVLCAGFYIDVVAKEGAQNITFDLYGKRRCHNSLKLRQPKIRLRVPVSRLLQENVHDQDLPVRHICSFSNALLFFGESTEKTGGHRVLKVEGWRLSWIKRQRIYW